MQTDSPTAGSLRIHVIGKPSWQEMVAPGVGPAYDLVRSDPSQTPNLDEAKGVLIEWRCVEGDAWGQVLAALESFRGTIVTFLPDDEENAELVREAESVQAVCLPLREEEITPDRVRGIVREHFPEAPSSDMADEPELKSMTREVEASPRRNVRFFVTHVCELLASLKLRPDVSPLPADVESLNEQIVAMQARIATISPDVCTGRFDISEVLDRALDTVWWSRRGYPPGRLPRPTIQGQTLGLLADTNEALLLAVSLLLIDAAWPPRAVTLPIISVAKTQEHIEITFRPIPEGVLDSQRVEAGLSVLCANHDIEMTPDSTGVRVRIPAC